MRPIDAERLREALEQTFSFRAAHSLPRAATGEIASFVKSAPSSPGEKRIPFSDDQRLRLAVEGKALRPAERKAYCRIISPQTLLDWLRRLAAEKYDSSKPPRKPGRPRTTKDTRELVIRLANENPSWGYPKIRDVLWGLKHDIARSTVARILEEAGSEPEPECSQKKSRKQFLERHWDALCACDFFAVETLGVFGAVRHMAQPRTCADYRGSAVGRTVAKAEAPLLGDSWKNYPVVAGKRAVRAQIQRMARVDTNPEDDSIAWQWRESAQSTAPSLLRRRSASPA